MPKSGIENIQTANSTFQTWLNSTNELIDLMQTDVVTVSTAPGGDIAVGNATIRGTFTANTVIASVNFRANTMLSTTTGGNIDFNDPARFVATSTNVATFLNINGARTRYSTPTTDWSIGLETSVADSFIISTGPGTPQFRVSASGGLTTTGSISSVGLNSTADITAPTFIGALTGNSSSATIIQTGRTIGMSGDVVWTSESFNGSGNVTGTSTIQNNVVSNAKLRDSTGLSVIGRTSNTTGDPGDIAAASDHQVLRRSGTALAFGAVALNQSAAVTGTLPVANGGTGIASLTQGQVLFGGTGGSTVSTDSQLFWENVDKRLGINITTPSEKLHVGGNVRATEFIGIATSARYADLAEKYLADSTYEPGTVVIFGGSQEITIADTHMDTRIAGVITTNPAHMMNSDLEGDFIGAVALRGRVPCKVTGKVRKGDLLVSSQIPGHATVSDNPVVGSVLGKALENKETEGLGIIEIVV